MLACVRFVRTAGVSQRATAAAETVRRSFLAVGVAVPSATDPRPPPAAGLLLHGASTTRRGTDLRRLRDLHRRHDHGGAVVVESAVFRYRQLPVWVGAERKRQGRRHLFSWSRGDEDEDKEDPGPAVSRPASDREWADRYRRPINRELWDEFRSEVQRTRNYLSSPSSSPGYRELATEMREAIAEAWNDPLAAPPLECGPTGKWVYRFAVLDDGGRGAADVAAASPPRTVFQRYPVASEGSSTPPPPHSSLPEVVLEIPPTAESLAMSLTPDETCVACLTDGDAARGRPQRVHIRRVDSGAEVSWTARDLLAGRADIVGDDATAGDDTDLVGLEWGPLLWQDGKAESGDQRDDQTNDFCYSLYLLLADHQGRPDRVVLCQIDPSTLVMAQPPVTIYRSDDPSVMVDVQRTKGCSCVAIRAMSKTGSEVFLSPAGESLPGQEPPSSASSLVSVRPMQEGVVYHVDVGEAGDVVVLTSDQREDSHDGGGGDYALSETSLSALPMPVFPPKDNNCAGEEEENGLKRWFVQDMDLFRTHIVLYERSRTTGDQRMRVRRRTTAASGTNDPGNDNDGDDTILELSSSSATQKKQNTGIGGNVVGETELRTPLNWSKLSPVGNMCFGAGSFRFELESPVAPGLVYEYGFGTGQITMVSGDIAVADTTTSETKTTTGPVDRSFRKEKILVPSLDGTRVPISLFYKDDDDAPRKTVVLVGYGAYGEPMDLGYNPGWKPLLDRGVVLAFAHTRGGGDLGRAWYASGRLEHKARGIEDYEACALYLKDRFGSSSSLVAKAFSAGGVLVGASVNRHPGLFDKVVLTNAFVDVQSTMGKPDLFLTEHEYGEFGNPEEDPIVGARIRSYCPVYNLDPVVQSELTRTRFLLIGTLDDPNVPYWNATLYFRKLLAGHNGKTPVGGNVSSDPESAGDNETNKDRFFLELQTRGGHHFSSENRIKVLALQNAFILNNGDYE